LLTGSLHGAFLKPIFLIMLIVRFHALIERQPINGAWESYLAQISDRFRILTQGSRAAAA
jgi:hypothetical protein